MLYAVLGCWGLNTGDAECCCAGAEHYCILSVGAVLGLSTGAVLGLSIGDNVS